MLFNLIYLNPVFFLQGTIVSIFNEASPLGKQYVFDIRRTCREVHDNARRAMYQPESATPSDGSTSQTSERLARLLDALTCRSQYDQYLSLYVCFFIKACLKLNNQINKLNVISRQRAKGKNTKSQVINFYLVN